MPVRRRDDDERLAAIQEENAFLAAVVSGSDDAIVSKLLDGTVRTWNATTNGPMIAVNQALGYRTTAFLREWQRRLA